VPKLAHEVVIEIVPVDGTFFNELVGAMTRGLARPVT
jgi:hypothetical protein